MVLPRHGVYLVPCLSLSETSLNANSTILGSKKATELQPRSSLNIDHNSSTKLAKPFVLSVLVNVDLGSKGSLGADERTQANQRNLSKFCLPNKQ